MGKSRRDFGMMAALLTPVFMGMTPVFGKLAIRSGLDAYTLAALRTCMAAALLWIIYGLFFRKFTFIFPAGVLGTFIVGAVNGLGSLLYYNGLLYLDDASLVQLINMMYVVFVMIIMRFYGQRASLLSVIRAIMALAAVYLLSVGGSTTGAAHWLGVGLMIGSAFMYALHVVLSQRVMFEMPAPTMALYAMTFMGLTVLIARLIVGQQTVAAWSPSVMVGWWYVLGLTAVTALSRVTLFAGVRSIGGLQTILFNMAEIGVTLLVGGIWLGERLSGLQWVGVAIMMGSVLLSRWDSEPQSGVYRPLPNPRSGLFSFRFGRRHRQAKVDEFATVSRLFRYDGRKEEESVAAGLAGIQKAGGGSVDLSQFLDDVELPDLQEPRK